MLKAGLGEPAAANARPVPAGVKLFQFAAI